MNNIIATKLKSTCSEILSEDEKYLFLRCNYKGCNTVVAVDDCRKKITFVSTDFQGNQTKKINYPEFINKYC